MQAVECIILEMLLQGTEPAGTPSACNSIGCTFGLCCFLLFLLTHSSNSPGKAFSLIAKWNLLRKKKNRNTKSPAFFEKILSFPVISPPHHQSMEVCLLFVLTPLEARLCVILERSKRHRVGWIVALLRWGFREVERGRANSRWKRGYCNWWIMNNISFNQ